MPEKTEGNADGRLMRKPLRRHRLSKDEEQATKSGLAVAISRILRQRRLSQTEASRVLRIGQPKVSALLNRQVEGFSVERLMRLLTALGRDVDIVVRQKPNSRKAARISIKAA